MEIAKDYILFILSLIVEKFSAGMGLILKKNKNIVYFRKDVETPSGKEHQFLALSQ